MDRRENLVKMGPNPVTLIGKEVKVGDKAENFTATKGDLTPFKLSDLDGKKKIISVVPSLDTGVCELQTIRFNEEAAKLDNTDIITISVDLPFAQKRFCSANSIENSITVSDYKDLDFGMKYGFVIEELRLLSRGIVVLDKDNTVKYVEYLTQVGEHPDYDKALEAVKAI